MSSTASSSRWRSMIGVIWDVGRPLVEKPLFSPYFKINSKVVRLKFHYIENHQYSLDVVDELLDGINVMVRAENEYTDKISSNNLSAKPSPSCIWYASESNIRNYISNFWSSELISFNVTFTEKDNSGELSFQFRSCDGKRTYMKTSHDMDKFICLENLSDDFSKLLETDAPQPDVVLACGHKTAPVHSLVLRSRSDVLAAALRNDMTESRTGRIEIREMDPEIFPIFVRYLYTGIFPDQMTVETAKCLLEAGDRHAVRGLVRRCGRFLEEYLSKENACEMLVLADRHNDPDFKERVECYILDSEIHLEDEWQNFHKQHPSLSSEVHYRFCMQFKKQKKIS